MDHPRGSGPGSIAPDGSAVDFYAAQPYKRETAGLVHETTHPGASILELGAGTGRMTYPLMELGHPVVAVDESAEMLAHIRGTETVTSRIEDLDLGRAFDLVLLASHVLEYATLDRDHMLRVCRQHMTDGGRFVFERQPPEWYSTVRPSTWSHDGMDFELHDLEHIEDGLIAATITTRMGDAKWSHSFTSRQIDDETLPEMFSRAGMRFEGFASGKRAWVMATTA